MELNSPQDYIEVAMRRKWWIIIPFILVMMGSYGVYKKLPKIYKATTLILVQPQKVPTSYVRPTVTLSVSDRLATLSQEILSRTSLEQVVTQLHLIEDLSDPLLINQKVISMRKSISIDVRGGRRGQSTSSFAVSFEDRDPANAARIVNKIASLFITENLRIREEQARGTAQFLEKELFKIEKRLKQKEEAIRQFKQQNMGELPGQLSANLRILEGLQQQVQINNESIISAQQRKENLKNQIDQVRDATSLGLTAQGVVTQDPLLAQLDNQRRTLQGLQGQYTDQHPDVIAAKASIEKLEAQIRERDAQESQETTPGTSPIFGSTLSRLNIDLQDVINQIDRLKREQANLKDQIELYQRRIENVPKREEQMSTLLRDYSLLQGNYQSLLDKKIQAELAENLERKQKGEQFKILDPATPPMYPFKPDKRKILGLAFALGLGLAGGLTLLREQMDRSFRKIDDVEQFLGFPVIATIPRIKDTRKEWEKVTKPQVRRHFEMQEDGGKEISTA